MRRSHKPMRHHYKSEAELQYEKDFDELMRHLKRTNVFGMTKDQVLEAAKSVPVHFDEYDEDEFYLTFLMMCDDYKELTTDPMVFVRMAKYFLEDDDIEMSPSEKLMTYIEEIVFTD